MKSKHSANWWFPQLLIIFGVLYSVRACISCFASKLNRKRTFTPEISGYMSSTWRHRCKIRNIYIRVCDALEWYAIRCCNKHEKTYNQTAIYEYRRWNYILKHCFVVVLRSLARKRSINFKTLSLIVGSEQPLHDFTTASNSSAHQVSLIIFCFTSLVSWVLWVCL